MKIINYNKTKHDIYTFANESNMVLCALPTSANESIPGIRTQAAVTGWNYAGLWNTNIDGSGIPDWSGLSARSRGSNLYGSPTQNLRGDLHLEFNAGSSDPKFSDITNWNNGNAVFIIISKKHFTACRHFTGMNTTQSFNVLAKDGTMHYIVGKLIGTFGDTNLYRIKSINGGIDTEITPNYKIKIYQILNLQSGYWEGLRIWHQVNNGMFVTTTRVDNIITYAYACENRSTTPTLTGLPILASYCWPPDIATHDSVWNGDSGSPILATYNGETYLIGMSNGGHNDYSNPGIWKFLESNLLLDGITITLANAIPTALASSIPADMPTPLSIDPYNSRFNLDITLEINSDTYSYSNMIYYGFYGGTSVQAQELNELQESIQNQVSLSNKLIGNWLEYNSNNVNKNIEQYNISSTLLTSVEDINGIGYIGRTVINGPGESLINGWYSYTDPKTGYNQYISLPAYEFNDFISDINIRLVKSTDPNWNFLSDENSTTSLNINGADRFQRFLSVMSGGGGGGGIPVTVHSALPLQRFLDMDIYGFAIEKSQRNTSIDNTFPIIPYTTATNSDGTSITPFSAAGSIDELRTLTRDKWSGAQGLAGLAFQAGALGLFQDNTYHSQQGLDSSNSISISWTEDVTIVGTYGKEGDIVFQGDNLTDTTPEFQSSVGTISAISENSIRLRFNTYSDHINFYKNFKGPSKFIVLDDDGNPTGEETPIPIRLYFNNKNNYIILTDDIDFRLNTATADGSSIQEMVAKEGVFPKSGLTPASESGYVFNYFDLGDSAKKIGSTQRIERSSINKYQWFDWTNNIVKGNNNNSIASGYHGNYIISNVDAQGQVNPKKINIPKGGYVQPLTPTVPPYDIFRVNPTFEEIQTGNSNLIVNGKAKIRELYSGSLGPIGSLPEQITPEFKHIDAITDDALITLDTEGVVTILLRVGSGIETGTDLSNTVYFYKEILEKPGILTDENGTVNTSVPNKYVYACMSSGFLGTPGWVWLLKENGKVYGFEIKTATERDSGNFLRIKTENFDSPLGFSTFPLAMNINNIQGTSNQALWKTSTYIKYILNLIPKVNGQRLPVIDIAGGYGSAGQFTCAFPPEEGEENTITFADGKTHPVQNVQLIDIIKETEWNSTIKPGYDHLQRIKSTYDVATKSWSYPNNDIFDVDVYNKIFGVLNETDGESYNIPPRGWGVERSLHQSWILSNNGMLVVFNVKGGNSIRERGSLAMQETGNTYWGMCVPKLPTINTVTNSTDKIILDGTFTNGTLPRSGGPFRNFSDKPQTNIFNRPNIILDSTLGGVFIKNPLDAEDNFKIDLNNNSGHALLQFRESILNTNGGGSKNVVVGCSVNRSAITPFIPLSYEPNYYKHIPHTWTLDEYSPGDQLKNTYKIIASANNSTVIYNDFTWKIIGKPINGIIPNNIKDIMIIDYNVNPQQPSVFYSVLVQNMNDTISMIVPPGLDMFGSKVRNGITRPKITDLTNVTHMVNHNDHALHSRVAIVSHNSNTWAVYLYSDTDLTGLDLVTTGQGEVKSITINEYHCSLIVLNTLNDTTEVRTFSFSENNPGVPSNIPTTSGTEKYRKITSTAISTVLLKEDGTFLKWIVNEAGIDGILNKITQESILVDDIYLGFWHSAIIKARDTGNNNYLIFHSSADQQTQKGRFRNIPVPLSVGRWNHNLGKIVANYKIIETVLPNFGQTEVKSINGYQFSPTGLMKANIEFNKDTMFSIEPTYFKQLGACHPPLRRKTVFDLKNQTVDPIFYPDDFSYDEWFGNTYAILDNVPGEDWNAYPHPSIELKFLSNWIDDSNIVEIIAFKDTDGNMPYTVINGQVSRNQAYSPYCSMTLTNLGNSEKTKNPVAWARSYGEGFCWIRQNGAICTHGVKFNEADHYAFAPMTWGTYPDIKNSVGVLYSDITSDPEIAQYKLEIEECKEIGKYIGQ